MLPSRITALTCVCLACACTPAAAQFDFLKGILSTAAGNAATGAAVGAAAGAATSALTQQGEPSPQDAQGAAATPPPPASPAELQAVLDAKHQAIDAPAELVKSNLVLKGKRYYVAEYRVLFEVGGRVTASTRASYFGGVDRGATRVSVNYEVPQPSIELMQQITDKAWADFQAQMAAAGLPPEPAQSFVQENGAVYEATADASRPGALVEEEAELGYGKRKYLVFAPTGMRVLPRSFIGLGTGNMGKRMEYVKGNMEALAVNMVVNVAAQESSGSGSSMFRRGSSANASAAMEISMAHRQAGVIHALAQGQAVTMGGPLPVPGQFANFRETGGYDSSKDAVVKGIQILGALTMGVAGNNSKRVDMAVDVDQAAMARMALQGLAGVQKAAVGAIK